MGKTPLFCPSVSQHQVRADVPHCPPSPGRALRDTLALIPRGRHLRTFPSPPDTHTSHPLVSAAGWEAARQGAPCSPGRGHIPAGLPLRSRPSQTLAAAAKYSPAAHRSLVATRLPAGASTRWQRHHVRDTLGGSWQGQGKANTGSEADQAPMEGAAVSFPQRLFLHCLSKACCSWHRGSGLFLDACFTSPRRWAGRGWSLLLLPGTLRPPAAAEVCPAKVIAARLHAGGLCKQEA